MFDRFPQPCEQLRVPQDGEKVHEFPIKIVINLNS